MIDLTGKVALVTGGARGIGRVDALTLARAGADVVVADIVDPGPLDDLHALGGKVLAVRVDVTDRQQVRDTVHRVRDEFDGLHILVNNAGALDHTARLTDQDDALWDRDLAVNLTGAYNCAKAVWPIMQEQQYGRIINMSSVAGTLGGFGQASYAASKAGLLGLTRTLALEGARHHITCNAVVAGIIATAAYQEFDAGYQERMARRTAFRRPGEPQDVADAVTFLASDMAGYITGVALPVAGGIDLFTF